MARFDAPWHFHPEIELTLIVKGAGRRFVGDSVEPFGPGDLILLGPNLPHFWHSEGAARGRAHSVVVQFRRDFLGPGFLERPEFADVARLLERSGRGLAFSPASPEFSARLRRVAALAAWPSLRELLDLLAELATAGGRPLTRTPGSATLGARDEARLARVYAHLAEHFRDPVSLDDLARAAAMTPAAFSRYFKRLTRRNPSDVLNDVRIEHATRLLRDTSDSVADIAQASGFPTLSNFNRRFRERAGCSPREYRRVLGSA